MKELSIEEKARNYDEAIERAKRLHSEPTGGTERIVCEQIFPELRESEDEKIRKAILEHIQFCTESIPDRDKFIEWLEKQGEKLPAGFYYVNSEGKKFYSDTFKYGDVILHVEKQDEQNPITFNDAHIIDTALNDYCIKQYNALHEENGGVLSFARLQHLAMDIYGWCKKQDEQKPMPAPIFKIGDTLRRKGNIQKYVEDTTKSSDPYKYVK